MIFDLDGVLVHSMPLHTEAWQQYLQKLGLKIDDVERRMHGKRNSELVREWIGDHLTEELVLGHGQAKEQLWRDLMGQSELDDHRVPGLIEFLERYRDVPKAIGSNAEIENIEFVLERFELKPFFPIVVNGYQVERPKPFPDIYLKAASLLGADPAHCVVFEDSPTGIEAGRAAGMRLVAIETTPTEFQAVDLQVPDFSDPRLEDWLQVTFPPQ
jgi:beta-phosphoglucomutase